MAHTAITFSRNLSVTKEASFKTLPQLASNDADVVAALANRKDWVLITNGDGSLRHVQPITELVTPG